MYEAQRQCPVTVRTSTEPREPTHSALSKHDNEDQCLAELEHGEQGR